MKTVLRFLTLAATSLCLAASAQSNAPVRFGPGFMRPYRNPDGEDLPLIRVLTNKFVDPDGNIVVFRGVSIADPDKIQRDGHWSEEHFEQVKAFGCTLVRIPVHPATWRAHGPQEYLKMLDQGVTWCAALKMHVIIDWHSIGNLHMELFQDPMYDTTQKETFEFWRTMARHYKGCHTVAFYELFNEPTLYRGQLGSMSWSEWRYLNEEMIKLIRAYDTEKIPLVAGMDWAYDLTALNSDPIQADGIGYVTHPYANKRSKPWEPKWEEDFGFAAGRYPMIATEIGFEQRNGRAVGPDDYGNAIVNYLEGKGISWTAWCFDPQWGPRLVKSEDNTTNYVLTASGEFFKQAIADRSGAAASTNAPAPSP